MGIIVLHLLRLGIYLGVIIWAGASLYYHNGLFLWFFAGCIVTIFVVALERVAEDNK